MASNFDNSALSKFTTDVTTEKDIKSPVLPSGFDNSALERFTQTIDLEEDDTGLGVLPTVSETKEIPKAPAAPLDVTGELGFLFSKFESGSAGSKTIARTPGDIGGASYGKWQIATKTGTINSFMNFLKNNNPYFHGVLNTAKPGTREYDRAWLGLADTDPDEFLKAQRDFIKTSHFDAANTKIKSSLGIDFDTKNPILQEVLWSVSVQHGSGGANSLLRASNINNDMSDEEVIKAIYKERRNVNKWFKSSSQAVKNSVKNRFFAEEKMALENLELRKEAKVSQFTPFLTRVAETREEEGFRIPEVTPIEKALTPEAIREAGAIKLSVPTKEDLLDSNSQYFTQFKQKYLPPSPILGTDIPTEPSKRLGETPFSAGFLSQSILGGQLKKAQPEQFDLAKENAKVITSFRAYVPYISRTALEQTDIGDLVEVYKRGDPLTTYEAGQYAGFISTWLAGSAASKIVSGVSTKFMTPLIAKAVDPKVSQSAINLLTKINESGVSIGTFVAVTGLSDAENLKETATDFVLGYGMGFVFESLANAKGLWSEFKGNQYKYFKGVKTPKELRQRLVSLKAETMSDAERLVATQEFEKIKKIFLDKAASTPQNVKAVVEVAEQSGELGLLGSPEGRIANSIDTMAVSTIQNGGVTISLSGHIPTTGYAMTIDKGLETIILKSEFAQNSIANFIEKNYDVLTQPDKYVDTWYNKDNDSIHIDVSTVKSATPETIKEAKDAGEIAVFDLDNAKEIPTGVEPTPEPVVSPKPVEKVEEVAFTPVEIKKPLKVKVTALVTARFDIKDLMKLDLTTFSIAKLKKYQKTITELNVKRSGKTVSRLSEKEIQKIVDIQEGIVRMKEEYSDQIKEAKRPSIEREQKAAESFAKRTSEEAKELMDIAGIKPDSIEAVASDISELLKLDLTLFSKELLKKHKKLLNELGKKGITKLSRNEVQKLIDIKDSIKDIRIEHKEDIKAVKEAAKIHEQERVAEIRELQKVKAAEKREVAKVKTTIKKKEAKLMSELKKLAKEKYVVGDLKASRDELIGLFDLKAKVMQEKTVIKLEKTAELVKRLEAEGEFVPQFVKDSVKRLDKRQIGSLTEEELEQYIDMATSLREIIKQDNKFFNEKLGADIQDTIEKTLVDIKAPDVEEFKRIGDIRKTKEFFWGINASIPRVNILDMVDGKVDSPLMQNFKSLQAGQNKVFEATRDFNEFFKSKGIDALKEYAKSGKAKAKPVELSSGKIVKLTSGEKIAIHLMGQQDASRIALTGGLGEELTEGFRQTGKAKTSFLSDADFKIIENSMTKKELEAANVMQEFYDMAHAYANEAYKAVTHTELDKIKNYYPVYRDELDFADQIAKFVNQPNLENQGFTKARIGSKKPIVLYDAWEALERHKTGVANLYGLAVPVRDFKKVMFSPQIKAAMVSKYGTAAKKGAKDFSLMERYWQDTIKDLQGGITISNQQEQLMKKTLSRFVTSILGLNPGVVMKQFASYPMAFTVIKLRYLARAIPKNISKKTMDNIAKKSGYFYIRTLGKIDRETGEVAQNLHKAANLSMKPIIWADLQTVSRIYLASEMQVKKENPSLKGEELKNAVNELFTEALETQPNYTVLERSGIMRSKSLLTKYVTLFGSARNAVFNSIRKGIIMDRGKKNKVHAAKAIAAAILSTLSVTSIDIARAKAEGKDKDFSKTFQDNMTSYVILADKITSFLRGYSFDGVNEQMLVGMMQDLYGLWEVSGKVQEMKETFDKMDAETQEKKRVTHEEKIASLWAENIKKVSTDTAKLLGIPFANAEKIYTTILRQTNPEAAYAYEKKYNYPTRTEFYDLLFEETADPDSPILDVLVEDMKEDGADFDSVKSSAINREMPQDEITEILKLFETEDDKVEDLPENYTPLEKKKAVIEVGLSEKEVDKLVSYGKSHRKKRERLENLWEKDYSMTQTRTIMTELYGYDDPDLSNSLIYDMIFEDSSWYTNNDLVSMILRSKVTLRGIESSVNIRNKDDKAHNNVSKSEMDFILDYFEGTLPKTTPSTKKPETKKDRFIIK